MEIDKKRGNSNVLMGRVLHMLCKNNINYDDRVLTSKGVKIGNKSFDTLRYMKDNYAPGSYNAKTGQYLLGYQNEELATFFGVQIEDLAKE